MHTMYERLMTLPIFKGVGPEQLSLFLEKTHLDFDNYEAGGVIADYGEECEGLKCVLSGRIRVVHNLSGGRAKLIAEYGPGKVLGLERLYGMDTRFGHVVRALTECGTMSFSKQQYMSLVQNNNICLINFLNYLSLRAQRVEHSVEKLYANTLIGRMATILSLLTSRDSSRIIIKNIYDMSDFKTEDELLVYRRDLETLSEKNLISIKDNNTVEVLSRSALIDFAESVLNHD